MLGTVTLLRRSKRATTTRVVAPNGATKYVKSPRELELTLRTYLVVPSEYAALESELLRTGRASFQVGLGKFEQL